MTKNVYYRTKTTVQSIGGVKKNLKNKARNCGIRIREDGRKMAVDMKDDGRYRNKADAKKLSHVGSTHHPTPTDTSRLACANNQRK